MTATAARHEGYLCVLDYPGLRREARVAELGLTAATGLRLAELLAPPPTAQAAPAYLAELLARRPAGECRAVLAYCASAPLAGALATRLATGGHRPPVVLFDAEPVTAATVLDAYRTTLAQLGASATAPETGELAALVHRPDRFLTAARRNLTGHVSQALRADGCPAGEADALAAQLTVSCLDWLTHLLAALTAPPPQRPGPALNIVSAETPGGDVRIACDRTSLLRDPRTREAALAFLAAHGVLPTE
ncbi:hypothetical protein ACWCV9_27305 [Streptomyces sp. NPDC001606]